MDGQNPTIIPTICPRCQRRLGINIMPVPGVNVYNAQCPGCGSGIFINLGDGRYTRVAQHGPEIGESHPAPQAPPLSYSWEMSPALYKNLSPPKKPYTGFVLAGFLLLSVFLLMTMASISIVLMPTVHVDGSTTLSGTVFGEDGGPIPAANVSVLNANINTVSDSSGKYTLYDVPAGTQEITAEKSNYRVQTKTIYLYGPGDTTEGVNSVDFILTNGEGSERISDLWMFASFGIVGATLSLFSLVGGIHTFRRKYFSISLVGGMTGIIFSVIAGSILGFETYHSWLLFLAALGAIFITVGCRKEYRSNLEIIPAYASNDHSNQ